MIVSVLCLTTRSLRIQSAKLPHFDIDTTPHKFVRISYKDARKPEGTEQLIFDDLFKLHPQFAEIVMGDNALCELRDAQIPLIMECFFNACGQCTYVSYLTSDTLIKYPEIDEKLSALNDKLTTLNVASHIPLNEGDKHFFWRYNFILR
ncbi:MAG: hypothetical protein ACRDDZ_00420 [Marinifilaceae bacterium]